MVVPDPALRAAVFAMPPFRGANGQFDRTRFNAVLANNNLTEASFLQLMRADLAGRQVQEAVRAGAVVPATLLSQAFDVAEEKRVAAMVALPFAAAPAPPAPTEAQLRRFYALHPDRYSTPERRRIQAVVLSTETIARGIEIPEADIRAYYDAHKTDYVTPEKRSAAGDRGRRHGERAEARRPMEGGRRLGGDAASRRRRRRHGDGTRRRSSRLPLAGTGQGGVRRPGRRRHLAPGQDRAWL